MITAYCNSYHIYSLGDKPWEKEVTAVPVTQMRTKGDNCKISWSGCLEKTQ